MLNTSVSCSIAASIVPMVPLRSLQSRIISTSLQISVFCTQSLKCYFKINTNSCNLPNVFDLL